VEQTVTRDGREIGVVRGRLEGTGEEAALYPGNLAEDPADILTPARQGTPDWADAAYRVTRFAPPILKRAPGEGLPHIRLDRAAEFLFGDRLR
jgi:predicted YcjX-like family ATPase